MKKNQIKSNFNLLKGKVKEVAGKAIGIREPGHKGNRLNAQGSIEAAYAALRSEYKKAS